jgi:hypothetical protein
MNMKMYVPRCTVVVRATFRIVFKLKISKDTYMYYYTTKIFNIKTSYKNIEGYNVYSQLCRQCKEYFCRSCR